MKKIDFLKREITIFGGELREAIREHLNSYLDSLNTDYVDLSADTEAWKALNEIMSPTVMYDGGEEQTYSTNLMSKVRGMGRERKGVIYLNIEEEKHYNIERVWYIEDWITVEEAVSFLEEYRQGKIDDMTN